MGRATGARALRGQNLGRPQPAETDDPAAVQEPSVKVRRRGRDHALTPVSNFSHKKSPGVTKCRVRPEPLLEITIVLKALKPCRVKSRKGT